MLTLDLNKAWDYQNKCWSEVNKSTVKFKKDLMQLGLIKELGNRFVKLDVFFEGDLEEYTLYINVYVTKDTSQEVMDKLKEMLNKEIDEPSCIKVKRCKR